MMMKIAWESIKKNALKGFLVGLLTVGMTLIGTGTRSFALSESKTSGGAKAMPWETVGKKGSPSKNAGGGKKRSGKDGQKPLSIDVEKLLNDTGADKAGTRIQVSLPGDVMFDSGKWEIKKSAEKLLYKFLEAIKGLKVKEILIEGYTDSRGPEDYNLALSRKRAAAVKEWLVKKGGLDGAKIVTRGYGESNPVAPNTNPDGSDNPEGRAKNRRVEVFVTLLGE